MDNSNTKNNDINNNQNNIVPLENEIRRYNEKNINEGKQFFKERYIENQFKQKNTKELDEYKKIKPSTIISKNKKEILKKEEERKRNKFIELFTSKTDKAIFCFNLKNYENSYQNLINSNIIFDINEFAEFLLVFPGLDKSIIGEFIAKKKSLNKNYEILKGYMSKINFKNMGFLESMRFIIKRLTFPLDTGLTMEIINEYTIAYYKDNNNSKNFKDSDALFTLACVLMSLNTQFTRKDIKNLQKIEKNEYIKMNTNCDTKFLDKIYDELQNNPFVMENEYLETIYKRDTITNYLYEPSINKNENTLLNYKEHISLLKKGQNFLKYGNYDEPHKRFLYLSEDNCYFEWYDPETLKIFRVLKRIEISKIKNVYIGISSSKFFEKANIPLCCDQQCFCIEFDTRVLALKNNDEKITKKWFYAISYLINSINNNVNNLSISVNDSFFNKKLRNSNSNKSKINQFWRLEVLVNWKYYRNYLKEGFDKKELEKYNNCESEKIGVKENENIYNTEEDDLESEKEIYNKKVFFEYYKLGLPKFIRKKIWPIIIGNKARITENIVEKYLKIIEQIDFTNLNKIYKEHNDTNQSEDDNELLLSEDIIMNEILNDVLKITNIKYIIQIKNAKLDSDKFANDLFKVIRIFSMYRKDIIYSKEIAYISTIFLLNTDNYFQALVNMINFLIDSPSLKFIQKNEIFEESRTSFFNLLFEKYLPRLYKHFNKIDVTPQNYFTYWISSLFIKVFPYEMILVLWDNYIVRGEIFLFEIGLTILKLQEQELLGLSFSKILNNLKTLPSKFLDDIFYKELYNIKIYTDFKYIDDTDLGYEKAILLQSYMNDKI